MPTPSMEDYIEQIYILIEEKGYARVSDIAENLSVHPIFCYKNGAKAGSRKIFNI